MGVLSNGVCRDNNGVHIELLCMILGLFDPNELINLNFSIFYFLMSQLYFFY